MNHFFIFTRKKVKHLVVFLVSINFRHESYHKFARKQDIFLINVRKEGQSPFHQFFALELQNYIFEPS